MADTNVQTTPRPIRPAIEVRLDCCSGRDRALVINALREKCNGDRLAARALNGRADNLARELNDQADRAEQIADDLEGA
jgi:hypothetical protein